MPCNADGQHYVSCFTEHKRWDGNKFHLFRAHPCYRSKESHPKDVWYDWAFISVSDSAYIPCQILCFLDLSELPARKEPVFFRDYPIKEPGQYVVVRKFKSPPQKMDRSELVEFGELEKGFFIFNCDAIADPVCVVPNIPMLPWAEVRGKSSGKSNKRTRKEMQLEARVVPLGGYFVVSSRWQWGDWFTDSVVLNTGDE